MLLLHVLSLRCYRTLLLMIMAHFVCCVFINPTFILHREVLPTPCFDPCDCSLSDSYALSPASCCPGSRCRAHEPYAFTALLASAPALNVLWCVAPSNILKYWITMRSREPRDQASHCYVSPTDICFNNAQLPNGEELQQCRSSATVWLCQIIFI